MPNTPNPRTLHEIAAQYGMSDEDFRRTDTYTNALREGSIIDPPATGPNVEPAEKTPDVYAGSVAAEANYGIDPSPEAEKQAAKVLRETKKAARVTTDPHTP